MGLFTKKKQTAVDHSPKTPEPIEETHASYDGSRVVGGLHWYKKQYERVMKLVLALGLGLLAAIGIIALLIITRPTPQFFAATPDLRLAPMVPLSEPLLTEQGLLNWVSETVTQAVSLDFVEWREKLSRSREHFDDDAFKSFLDSLQKSGVLDLVRDKRLNVSASISRAPVITASGLVNGRATWRVEFPLVVSYESSQGVETTQKLLANVLVRRASTAKTPRGVVIQQVVLKRDS